MLTYAIQRTGVALAVAALSMTILFALIQLIPGDAATIALGPRASEAMKAAFREEMGLDLPVAVQLLHFFQNLLSGDLGTDIISSRPIATIIAEALPNTLILASVALGWSALLGTLLGCLAAARRNSVFDRVTAVLSVAVISMPSFLVAVYSLLLFSVTLGWFPALGAGEDGDRLDRLHHLVLPAFAIGLGWVGYIARLTRASMIEVLTENHIRTLRAFGLRERTILFRYALKIAVLPTLSVLAVAFGGLLASAVFAELVFNRPGIGLLVFNAASARNFPLLAGAVVVIILLFTSFTLIADLVIAWIDPRVRAAVR